MKVFSLILLLCCAVVLPALGDPALNNLRSELKSLPSIEGAAVGYGGVPGRFYLLYSYCVIYGDEKIFSAFLSDDSPIVAAMGGICMLDKYPTRKEEVMMRMKSDQREVLVFPFGCLGTKMTLAALFDKAQADPNFIVAMKFRKKDERGTRANADDR